jgi:hypothetical protein
MIQTPCRNQTKSIGTAPFPSTYKSKVLNQMLYLLPAAFFVQ